MSTLSGFRTTRSRRCYIRLTTTTSQCFLVCRRSFQTARTGDSLLYILEADEEDRITDIGFTTDGREAVIVKESGAAVSGVLFHDFETLLDRASMLTAG